MDRCVGDASGDDRVTQALVRATTISVPFRSILRGPCITTGASIVNLSLMSYLLYFELLSVMICLHVLAFASIDVPSILPLYAVLLICSKNSDLIFIVLSAFEGLANPTL